MSLDYFIEGVAKNNEEKVRRIELYFFECLYIWCQNVGCKLCLVIVCKSSFSAILELESKVQEESDCISTRR